MCFITRQSNLGSVCKWETLWEKYDDSDNLVPDRQTPWAPDGGKNVSG